MNRSLFNIHEFRELFLLRYSGTDCHYTGRFFYCYHHHRHRRWRRRCWETGQLSQHSDQATGWIIGESGFDSRQEQKLLVSAGFMPVLRPALPIQFIPGDCSLGIKRLVCEGDHLCASCAEILYAWSYTSTPPNLFMAWSFSNNGDYFTFHFWAYFRQC